MIGETIGANSSKERRTTSALPWLGGRTGEYLPFYPFDITFWGGHGENPRQFVYWDNIDHKAKLLCREDKSGYSEILPAKWFLAGKQGEGYSLIARGETLSVAFTNRAKRGFRQIWRFDWPRGLMVPVNVGEVLESKSAGKLGVVPVAGVDEQSQSVYGIAVVSTAELINNPAAVAALNGRIPAGFLVKPPEGSSLTTDIL